MFFSFLVFSYPLVCSLLFSFHRFLLTSFPLPLSFVLSLFLFLFLSLLRFFFFPLLLFRSIFLISSRPCVFSLLISIFLFFCSLFVFFLRFSSFVLLLFYPFSFRIVSVTQLSNSFCFHFLFSVFLCPFIAWFTDFFVETTRFSQRWFLITSESRLWKKVEEDVLYPVLPISVLDEVSFKL